jgi:hypothetical protein
VCRESIVTKIQITDLQSIKATEAKITFGDPLHQTSVNGKKLVVDRNGKPVSVLLSYNEYISLLERANLAEKIE